MVQLLKKLDRFLILILFIAFYNGTYSQTTIYARANGNWNDNTAGTGTWSTIGPSDAACSCIPTALDSVVISGFNVTMDADGDSRSLTILSGSSLSFNNSIGLDINSEAIVTVNAGGSITHGGSGSGAHIDFEAGRIAVSIALGGTFSIEDINIAANDTLTLSGAGDLTLTDDFSFIGADAYVTNNLSGDFNLTGSGASSLWFTTTSSGCTFINNGKINCDRYIAVQGINSTLINNDSIRLTNASFGVFFESSKGTGTTITNSVGGFISIAGNFNVANNQMTFNNNGVLDLEGNLTSWSASAPSEFHNLPGSTLRFAGTGQFYGDFYANYDANMVVFDNTTTLQNELIDPVDNFWNLTFSGFQKQIKSDITCMGDFTTSVNVFSSTNRTFTMDNGGTFTINSGGSFSRTSGNGTLIFEANETYSMVINDIATGFAWSRISVQTGANVTISGTGKIDLETGNTSIRFLGSNASITDNLDSTLCAGVLFLTSSSNNTFTSNGNISLSGDVFFGGTNNSFVNNDSLLIGDDILYSATASSGNSFSNGVNGYANVSDDVTFSNNSNSLTNAGTFDCGSEIVFQAQLCTLSNSGAFSTGSNIRMVDASDDDNRLENLSGGTISIAGELQFKDADFVFSNLGIVNLTGRFDDMAGTDSIINGIGATWNYEGIHNSAINSEIDFYGDFDANTFNYTRSDGVTQLVFVPKDAYWNLILSGSGDKRTEGDININGNMTISGTSNLDANTGNDNISIAGNWISTSTFDEGTELVTFNGTLDQTINTLGGETFYNLTIDKVSGKVILSSNTSIDRILTLTNGACDLNGNTITLNVANVLALLRTNGYVISEDTDNSSKFIRNIGTAIGSFIFPFGKTDGTYIPFTMETTSGDMGVVTVSTYPTGSDNLPWPSSPDVVTNLTSFSGASPDNRDFTIDRFWQIDRTGMTGLANVTYTYAQAEVTASIIGNESMLQAQRYNTSTDRWEPAINGQIVDAVNNTVFVPSVSSFSPHSLALMSSPLPIVLASFSVWALGNRVEMEWETMSEINNDFFLIQKSNNGLDWTNVKRVEGQGNSNVSVKYIEQDPFPYKGVSYYRLKQVDFDGKYSYSDIEAVHVSSQKNGIIISPNPSGDYISVSRLSGGLSDLTIYNSSGTLVNDHLDIVMESDDLVKVRISKLEKGVYLLKSKEISEVFIKL